MKGIKELRPEIQAIGARDTSVLYGLCCVRVLSNVRAVSTKDRRGRPGKNCQGCPGATRRWSDGNRRSSCGEMGAGGGYINGTEFRRALPIQ